MQILTDFSEAQVLPIDDAAAAQFLQLQHQKIRIGTMDLRIGSIALSRSMTLLSRSLTDFNQVPSLRVLDWTT